MNSYPGYVPRPQCSAGFSRIVIFLQICLAFTTLAIAQQSNSTPELTRTVRTWEFLPVVGSRAGLFGNQTGQFEAWVYPLKLFRDFHLTFHVGDRALPAESLARSLTVRLRRPRSCM